MIHGGCSIIFFLYYSMLITLPVFLFLCTYKRVSNYCVITLLCDCFFACVVWSADAFFFFFSFNVVCIHMSVLLPATHIPTSLLPELP